ncbi:DUF4230 domain-containing protein [Cytophaga aurantiaca]|uniref:DUF4230 domain-containing protein n=1 Tax=Cytophaga aurantiaca TaxID=29530 RepID=UPI00036D932D|nr:DUF4230 domain-containing protein [Cytophaga aurantiaca]
MGIKFILKLLPWALISVLAGYIYFTHTSFFSSDDTEDKIEVTNNIIIEKIELLGKLELCKFYMKDIVEHKVIAPWYDKNSKVILIISGEAVGCIDLRKIDSTAVQITDKQVIITLPPAEICTFKVDHQASKIYDIETGFFEDDKKIIDKAYQLAEAEIQNSAKKMGIEKQTRLNAEIILKPFLAGITDKEIVLK